MYFSFGLIKLEVKGEDARGLIYQEAVSFHLGLHTLTGKLNPPPSNPELPVGNLEVSVIYQDGDVSYRVTAEDLQNSVPYNTLSNADDDELTLSRRRGGPLDTRS